MQVLRREDVLQLFLVVRSEDRRQRANPVVLVTGVGEGGQRDHRVAALSRQGLQHVLLLGMQDRKSTRLNSSHGYISYAVFCLKKKKTTPHHIHQHYPYTECAKRHKYI